MAKLTDHAASFTSLQPSPHSSTKLHFNTSMDVTLTQVGFPLNRSVIEKIHCNIQNISSPFHMLKLSDIIQAVPPHVMSVDMHRAYLHVPIAPGHR